MEKYKKSVFTILYILAQDLLSYVPFYFFAKCY